MHTNINATIDSLQNANRKLNNITGGVGGLSEVVTSLQRRIRYEEQKLSSVEYVSQKSNTFLSNTIAMDCHVASMVARNQEKFFSTHAWLRPTISEEKSWWQQRVEDWNNLWGKAGDWFKNALDGIVSFVKEHAVELIIGAVAVVVGAALIALTGGTAAAFLSLFKVALLAGINAVVKSAIIGGVINAVVALFTGDNILKAFGDGFASGFMWGGIFFFAGSTFSALSRYKEISKIKKTQNYMERNLRHEFKHAKDFGINGNSNKLTLSQYEERLIAHKNNADKVLSSMYRGEKVYVFYDSSTGVGAGYRLSGEYWWSWKLSEEQLLYHTAKNAEYMKMFSKEVISNATKTSISGGVIFSFLHERYINIKSLLVN